RSRHFQREGSLRLHQCPPHGRHDGDLRSRLADLMAGEDRAIEPTEIDSERHPLGHRLVAQRQAGVEQRLGGRPVGEARIEMLEAVDFGDPPRQRSLAGGGRPVDGDDESHQAALFSTGSIFAPRPAIKPMNSGKLVAMIPASSTVTGCSDTRPMTRKLMAIRWSRWVTTALPCALP